MAPLVEAGAEEDEDVDEDELGTEDELDIEDELELAAEEVGLAEAVCERLTKVVVPPVGTELRPDEEGDLVADEVDVEEDNGLVTVAEVETVDEFLLEVAVLELSDVGV